jgi:hypothetical protein
LQLEGAAQLLGPSRKHALIGFRETEKEPGDLLKNSKRKKAGIAG